MSAGSITQRIRLNPGAIQKVAAERVMELAQYAKTSLGKAEIFAVDRQEADLKNYNYRQIVEGVIRATIGYRIRQMLLQNYQRANLGNWTPQNRKHHKGQKKAGWLRDMLAKVQVYPIYKTSGGFRLSGIGYRMPDAPEDYHAASAALGFGSVHTGKAFIATFDVATGAFQGNKYRSLLGSSAKRSLKKFANTGKITKRSRTAIQKDYSTRLQGTVRKGVSVWERPREFGERTKAVGLTNPDHGSKTIWTTRAYPYWLLEPGQIEELNRLFSETLKSEIKHFSQGS